MSSEKNSVTKKKDRRRAYLNDFQIDENGTYVYQGDVYEYVEQEHSLLSIKIRLCAFGIVMLLTLAAAGFIQTSGMTRCVYVMLPYVAGLCGSISVCWALIRFCSVRPPLREYVYQETVAKLPNRAIFIACCSVITLLGEPVYLFSNGLNAGGSGIGLLVFPILEGIALAAALLLRTVVLQMEWKKR